MQHTRIWILSSLGAGVVFALALYHSGLWQELNLRLTWHGWLAMTLGIILTTGLGVALMVLVFVSNRHGFDDDVANHFPDDHMSDVQDQATNGDIRSARDE